MTMISFVTSSSSSSSSSRSSSSSSSSSTPIDFFVFFGTLMICFALLFVVQHIGPKAVSSFSLTSSSSTSRASSSALFQSSTTTTTTTESTTPSSSTTDTALMEAQAGGNSSNRRRRKQRIKNYLENKSGNNDDDETSTKADATVHNNKENSSSSSSSSSFQEPNEPLVPFESVKSVKLIDIDDANDESVRVEVSLTDDTTPMIINPIDIDQTVDFNLWMLLRKEIVDVSASQLSVVLDNNYFTSRAQLLSDKISVVRRRKKKEEQKLLLQKQQQQQQNDVVDNIVDNTDLNNDSQKNQTASSSSSRMGNSKACAWGVKMEPIAFAQYKDIVENNRGIIINDNVKSDDDDDDTNSEEKKRNFVEETGMYLMRYTDPATKKTFTFGASPDGLVTEYNNSNEESVGVLEIKSLWGRRNKSTLPTFDQCPNRFYDQIQGQLAVCDKEWCDLMLFIPPGSTTGTGTTVQRSNKRKGKSKAKRRKQQLAKDANAAKVRKSKGNNYAIVRVKRNRIYWNETVLPALMKFCNEVESLSELSESELELKLLEEAKESDESEAFVVA